MPLPFKYSEFVVKRVARYGRMIAVNLAVKHVIVTGTVLNAIVKNIIVNPHCMQYSGIILIHILLIFFLFNLQIIIASYVLIF